MRENSNFVLSQLYPTNISKCLYLCPLSIVYIYAPCLQSIFMPHVKSLYLCPLSKVYIYAPCLKSIFMPHV